MTNYQRIGCRLAARRISQWVCIADGKRAEPIESYFPSPHKAFRTETPHDTVESPTVCNVETWLMTWAQLVSEFPQPQP
jgi:hypothetical protein